MWNYIKNQKLEGDYLEFGVYEGKSFVCSIRNALRNRLKTPSFYAFDSFQGLPKTDCGELYHEGQFRANVSILQKKLSKINLSPQRVHIVPGWYSDTLNQENRKQHKQKASFVFIDCDLYSSAILCLNYITPLVQPGMILAFDDWHSYKSNEKMGEQRAFKEWISLNPQIKPIPFQDFMVLGKTFIITEN